MERKRTSNPVIFVRWEGGPPVCFYGSLDYVKKMAEKDERTRRGAPYVIIK